MKEFPWIELGGEKFVLGTGSGRAIVQPRQPPVRNEHAAYEVRLELPSGEKLLQEFYDLETCKTVAQVNLPLLDQVEGDLSDCGHVEETLNLCQQLISPDNDAIHWQRIEYFKAWIAQRTGQSYHVVKIPIPTYEPPPFDWKEDGNQFYVVTPHGRAVITETRNKNVIGGGIRHEAKIIHHSGAVLNCHSWVDFMEAEYAVKRILSELLRNPGIAKGALEFVEFTSDICGRILPENADPIHLSRLGALSCRIFLAVD